MLKVDEVSAAARLSRFFIHPGSQREHQVYHCSRSEGCSTTAPREISCILFKPCVLQQHTAIGLQSKVAYSMS